MEHHGTCEKTLRPPERFGISAIGATRGDFCKFERDSPRWLQWLFIAKMTISPAFGNYRARTPSKYPLPYPALNRFGRKHLGRFHSRAWPAPGTARPYQAFRTSTQVTICIPATEANSDCFVSNVKKRSAPMESADATWRMSKERDPMDFVWVFERSKEKAKTFAQFMGGE